MAPDKPPPLPLAPDRAALSNRITLLLASQSSVLKTMNLSPSVEARRRRQQSSVIPRHEPDDDDSDLFRSRPNEGVGYIPDKAQVHKDALSKEDRMLRGRLLGKKGSMATDDGSAGVRKRRVEDDDDDDDPGRSSLGKRKRPRSTAEETAPTNTLDEGSDAMLRQRTEEQHDTADTSGNVDESAIAFAENTRADTALTSPTAEARQTVDSQASTGNNKRKRKKKKTKKKNVEHQNEL